MKTYELVEKIKHVAKYIYDHPEKYVTGAPNDMHVDYYELRVCIDNDKAYDATYIRPSIEITDKIEVTPCY